MSALITEARVLPSVVLITGALARRPGRSSSLQAEAAIYSGLFGLDLEGPSGSVAPFLEAARRLCSAGSTGLSLLRTDESGTAFVRWESISGAMASHEGTETARNSSPCGMCLDAGATVLLWRPERAFPSLSLSLPPIVEDLIVPLLDANRKPLGTLWAAHHDARHGFTANDAQVLEKLATHLLRNLKLQQAAREHTVLVASVERHQEAQRSVTRELTEERGRRALSEASERALRQALVFKEATVYEAHHRVKNTLQITTSLLSMHATATDAPDVRHALEEASARLILLARVHEMLYRGNAGSKQVFMSTLLDAIGDALRKSFAERSGQITLQITSDPILLAADDAIPLALLANEAMTNAYKHAFSDQASGEINVHLSRTQQGTLLLEIADNGVGLLSGEHHDTLGLRLVRIFATQLRGELNFSTTTDLRGTRLQLTMPSPREPERTAGE